MPKMDLGEIAALPEVGIKSVCVGTNQYILLSRKGDEVFAVDGICPHRGAMLCQGNVLGTTVICPWHDWAFDLTTGAGITNPLSQLTCYKVTVENSRIYVDLPNIESPE